MTEANHVAIDGELIVREARPEDRAVIFDLYSDPDRAYGSSPMVDPVRQEELWLEVKKDSRQTILVGEINGQVIGTLTVIVIPNLGHDGHPWAAIENVVVKEAYRSQGVGRVMMSEAGRIAFEQDCYKIVLSSNLVRERAHQFYRNLGWKQSHLGFSLGNPKHDSGSQEAL